MRHGWLAMSARSLCWPRPLREGAGGCRRRRTAGPSVARRQDTTWRLSETGTKTPVTRTFWLWPAPSNGWSSRGTRISGRWRSGIGRLIVASFGWWSCRRHENRPEDSAHTRTGVAPRSTGHGGSASDSHPRAVLRAWKGPIRRTACLRSIVWASLDNAGRRSRVGAIKSLLLSAIGRRRFRQLGFCACFHVQTS